LSDLSTATGDATNASARRKWCATCPVVQSRSGSKPTFLTMPSRSGRSRTPSIREKDFNVADLVFAEGLGHGLFSESRTDEGDRSVDPKRRISTSCSKHQVAA